MTRDISITEWLDALVAASAAQDDSAFTVSDLVREWGHSEKWVRTHLRALAAAGAIQLSCVQVQRVALDGRLARVPAYRITKVAG